MNKKLSIIVWLMGILIFVAGSTVAAKPVTVSAALISTVTPTRTPVKNYFQLNRARLNKIPPKDILQQISFFGGGGGVICYPDMMTKLPAIAAPPEDGVLMTESTLRVCGWEKGEILKGSIVYPNGHIVKKSVTVQLNEGMYFGDLSFSPGLNDPVGTYTFVLEGKIGIIKDKVNFKKPIGPHLFVVDKNTIMFYGFSPLEKVKLVQYGMDGKFIGWLEIPMDANGQMVAKSSEPFNGYFWAVGKNGDAELPKRHYLSGATIYPSLQDTVRATICGGLSTRLVLMEGGRVAFTDGADLNVRNAAGLSKKVIAKLPEGETFLVLEGPKCADGLAWWRISTTKPDVSGWVAETYGGVYLIEPQR